MTMATCHPDLKHYARELCMKCYYAAPHVKAVKAAYRATPARKVAQAAYNATPKHKVAQAAYEATLEGKVAHVGHAHARRAREGGNGGSHTTAEWIVLCWASGWRCAYCSVPLDEKTAVREHRTPLCRGGLNAIENIAVSCGPCNSRKGRLTDVEFMERLAVLAIAC